jgi:hypothetical protein
VTRLALTYAQRRGEPPAPRVVVAGAEVIQPALHVPLLAGEEPVVLAGAGLRSCRSEHVVAVGCRHGPAAVREAGGGAEAIVQEVRLVSAGGCQAPLSSLATRRASLSAKESPLCVASQMLLVGNTIGKGNGTNSQ